MNPWKTDHIDLHSIVTNAIPAAKTSKPPLTVEEVSAFCAFFDNFPTEAVDILQKHPDAGWRILMMLTAEQLMRCRLPISLHWFDGSTPKRFKNHLSSLLSQTFLLPPIEGGVAAETESFLIELITRIFTDSEDYLLLFGPLFDQPQNLTAQRLLAILPKSGEANTLFVQSLSDAYEKADSKHVPHFGQVLFEAFYNTAKPLPLILSIISRGHLGILSEADIRLMKEKREHLITEMEFGNIILRPESLPIFNLSWVEFCSIVTSNQHLYSSPFPFDADGALDIFRSESDEANLEVSWFLARMVEVKQEHLPLLLGLARECMSNPARRGEAEDVLRCNPGLLNLDISLLPLVPRGLFLYDLFDSAPRIKHTAAMTCEWLDIHMSEELLGEVEAIHARRATSIEPYQKPLSDTVGACRADVLSFPMGMKHSLFSTTDRWRRTIDLETDMEFWGACWCRESAPFIPASNWRSPVFVRLFMDEIDRTNGDALNWGGIPKDVFIFFGLHGGDTAQMRSHLERNILDDSIPSPGTQEPRATRL